MPRNGCRQPPTDAPLRQSSDRNDIVAHYLVVYEVSRTLSPSEIDPIEEALRTRTTDGNTKREAKRL